MRKYLDKTTRKYRWIVAALLFGNVITGWTLGWLLAERQGQTVSVSLTKPTYPGHRSMHWPVCQFVEDPSEDPTVHGCGFFQLSDRPIRFPRPTEQELDNFRERTQVPENLMGVHDPITCPILSEVQLDRFEQARAMALASPQPSGAWEWPLVRETMRAVDEEMPLCLELDQEGDGVAGSYSNVSRDVSISERVLEGDVESIASVLIHEATHATYDIVLGRMSGLEPSGLTAALLRCGDVREVARTASEALARLNEYAWNVENRFSDSPEELRSWQLAERVREGDLHDRLLFAQHVMLAGFHEVYRTIVRDSSRSERAIKAYRAFFDRACGPLVGGADGTVRYTFPTDVEPELLPDMVQLPDIGIEAICEIDNFSLTFDHPCSIIWPEDTESFNRSVLGI